MNVKEEQICRLCLGVAENDFHLIDDITRQMLEVLSLKLNLDVSREPIICKDCTDILIKCYNFKSSCLDTEKLKRSSADGKNEGTFELKDEYNDGNNIEIADDTFVCPLCSNRSTVRNFVLRTSKNDITIAEYLRALTPKMDFDVTENPVICTSCRQDSEYYIKFAANCMNVEEKINKYCRSAGAPFYALVKLSDVLYDTLEFDYTRMRTIKQEDVSEDIGQAPLELNDGELIKVEELVDVKEHLVSSNVPVHKSDICELGSNNRMENGADKKGNVTLSTRNGAQAQIFKCAMCAYETKRKCHLKRHILIHRDITEVETYKCTTCTFKTKREDGFKRHMLIHVDVTKAKMFKCSMCTYEAKQNYHLKRHMLIHKDVTEVEMYKCTKCTFVTKREGDFKRHSLIHKDVTEVEMYKCSMCPFETKRKSGLKTHTLIHKDVTEVEIFKCSMCTYETNRKSNLSRHALLHNDLTDGNVYTCSTCPFQTRQKRGLKAHTLLHRDVTEIDMFRCSACSYETKQKSHLKRHMLVHKDVADVVMYKCAMCTHETKYKRNLRSHMLIHRDVTQVRMYKCSKCAFQTKYKHNFEDHAKRHK